MAYDEGLAERVRALLAGYDDVTERKMFGGIGFMIGGNMAVGVTKDDLMVRLDPEQQDRALDEPGARMSEMAGRPMRGWLLVAPEATASEDGLRSWVDRGAAFASSLPPK